MKAWIADAQGAGCREPAAMSLATVDSAGRPSNRIVLFKGFDRERLSFYSNYESRKAAELQDGAPVALCFWWDQLYRQLRIEGAVERLSAEQSASYFASRPRGSQLGAWASRQSRPIADRQTLDRQYADTETRFAGRDVPCPAYWGGYAVTPAAVEFWQGLGDRMHDRRAYTAQPDESWTSTRLQP